MKHSLELSYQLARASHTCHRASTRTRVSRQWRSVSSQKRYASVIANDDPDKRERVVILGSGWGGYVAAAQLDPAKFRVTVISPRTYFVFTPLLTDAAVGTLEFRHTLESVRRARKGVKYIQAWADDVDFAAKTVEVEPAVLDPAQSYALTGAREEGQSLAKLLPEEERAFAGHVRIKNHVPLFPVKYDKLIVAVGSYNQTFNTPGVRENAYFLKDVGDARRIRKRILELFEFCHLPFIGNEVKRQLLHFCIVGGGPTGIEFAGNLSDLIHQDMRRYHPDLMQFVKITVYDVAPKVLPMFDAALADYATKQYSRKNIEIKTSHHVEELRKGPPNSKEPQDKIPPGRVFTIRTKEDGEVGIGMCVWSTGLMNNPFIAKALSQVRRFPTDSAKIMEGSHSEGETPTKWTLKRHPKTGSLVVDDHFRVQLDTGSSEDESQPRGRAVMQDVFALGDCTVLDGVEPPLPATAQVTNQEAKFLATHLNKHASSSTGEFDVGGFNASKGFNFHNRGVMTFLGGGKAILQGPSTSKGGAAGKLKGFIAYVLWRGAYLTMTLSWRNKFLIPVQWLAVKIFGRSVSRF